MAEFADLQNFDSRTGTVDAAVFGAGSAGERELLLQGPARAVDAHGGVAGSDSGGGGEGFEGGFGQVDAADDLAVLRLEG